MNYDFLMLSFNIYTHVYVSVEEKGEVFTHLQGVPKKGNISECCSDCCTARLILNLEYSFIIHSKMEIHTFVQSTELILSDIRELKN